MSEFKPDASIILGTILRELEQTLVPELSSTHAQTVAHLMGQGLRNLLVREGAINQLMNDWNESMAEVVAASGGTAEDLAGKGMVETNLLLSERVADIVSSKIAAASADALDAVCRQALNAERAYYDAYQEAVDTVQLPERSPQKLQRLDVTPERLNEYFSTKLTQFKNINVTGVTPILSGFSKQTYLVDMDADGEPFPVVIRRNIEFGGVDTSVVDEYPLVAALHKLGLQVPEPVLLETDESVLGQAFCVIKRNAGAAAASTMAGVVAGPEMKAAAEYLAKFIAELHSLDPNQMDLPESFYDPSLTTKDYLIQQIDLYQRYYDHHCTRPSPVIASAFAWLRTNVPEVNTPPKFVHGDAGLHNILMDGDKMTVMLDWELAHPGDATQDVAYTRKWIDQFMDWDDFLALYCKYGGEPYHQEREKFYAVLSDVMVACMGVRVEDMLAKTDHPEITYVYASQHYNGYYIRNVAGFLLDSES